jgi:hypothetical protein
VNKVIQNLVALKFIKKNFSFFYLGIHLDEIIVYETIPSDTLDQELKEYLKNHGVKNDFHLNEFLKTNFLQTPDVLGFFSPSGFDSVFKSSQRIDFDLTNSKKTVRNIVLFLKKLKKKNFFS